MSWLSFSLSLSLCHTRARSFSRSSALEIKWLRVLRLKGNIPWNVRVERHQKGAETATGLPYDSPDSHPRTKSKQRPPPYSPAAAAKLLPHGFLYSCSLLSQGLSAETEIREVGRRLSLADTQTGRYGRLYIRRRLCARRSSRRTALHWIIARPPSRCSRHSSRTQLSSQLNPWHRYRCRCLQQMPIAGAYSRKHLARGFTLSVDLSLAELRH
jgi:hypothetical protein